MFPKLLASLLVIPCMSLTLREEQRLMMFENKVLRYLELRDEITGEWRKMHIAELMHCMFRLT